MIVRVTFENNLTMMFGDSYKPWRMQFAEYCWDYRKDLDTVEAVDICSDKWIGWGGLKWCPEERFQLQLNREGCQESDDDNSNPRKYEDMKFKFDSKIAKIAQRIFKDAKSNVSDNNLIFNGKLPKDAI